MTVVRVYRLTVGTIETVELPAPPADDAQALTLALDVLGISTRGEYGRSDWRLHSVAQVTA